MNSYFKAKLLVNLGCHSKDINLERLIKKSFVISFLDAGNSTVYIYKKVLFVALLKYKLAKSS